VLRRSKPQGHLWRCPTGVHIDNKHVGRRGFVISSLRAFEDKEQTYRKKKWFLPTYPKGEMLQTRAEENAL
jgi:hypothetical protein